MLMNKLQTDENGHQYSMLGRSPRHTGEPDRQGTIELPPKLIPVFSGKARYRGSYGGRGSAKTRSFATMIAVKGMMAAQNGQTGVLLCAREHLNSLSESSMEEVKAAIRSVPWLDNFYDIGEKYIRSKCRRISFVFAGLRHNLDDIKSKARVLIAWVDEAEGVHEAAWQKLLPTVREANSEVWLTWNPEMTDSATHRRFRLDPPANAKIVELNWRDNPWFPEVLNEERLNDQRYRPDTYEHIWEGGFYSVTEAQVFARKSIVQDFAIGEDWDGPYQGGDFGFSRDPTAAVRCYIHDAKLYVSHELYRKGLELTDYRTTLEHSIPNFSSFVSRWDNSRPESVSFLNRDGLTKATSAKKWSGSVEDGIQFIKSFDMVVIHPTCEHIAKEFRLYSYKIDRLSGDPQPDLMDTHNHAIDALRYALTPLIRARANNRLDDLAIYGERQANPFAGFRGE